MPPSFFIEAGNIFFVAQKIINYVPRSGQTTLVFNDGGLAVGTLIKVNINMVVFISKAC